MLGDGILRKRGFTSLYVIDQVSSLIGSYTGKVVNILVKCANCKACESWAKKIDTEEYKEWSKTHAPHCSANQVVLLVVWR